MFLLISLLLLLLLLLFDLVYTSAEASNSCSESESPKISTLEGNFDSPLIFCHFPSFYVQTGGGASGSCSYTTPCGSFEAILTIVEERGDISIMSLSFSNGNVSVLNGNSIRVITHVDYLPNKASLSYSAAGSVAPFFTVNNSNLIISQIAVLFNDGNQGSFIRIEGIMFFFFFF
jgi:hypothetical protein